MISSLVRAVALHSGAVVAVAARRTASTVCTYLLVLALVLAGLGFTTTAALLALSEALGPVYGFLVVGGLYLLAALITFLAYRAR